VTETIYCYNNCVGNGYNLLQQKLSSARQYFRGESGTSETKTVHFPMREKRTKLTISVSITVPETILWTFSIGGRTIPRLDDKILCTIFNI